MNNSYIATLLEGSALGSSILGVVFGLVYIKQNYINNKKKIDIKLKVNINSASSPAKYFFKSITNNYMIDIINEPLYIHNFNGKHHPCTVGKDNIELFYAPGIPGYSLLETDYCILQDIFTLFWNSLGLFNNIKIENEINLDNYICLHMRRGDKLIYEASLKVHMIEEYKIKIEEYNSNNSNNSNSTNNILIVTDEYSTFLEFKEKCPDWNITTTSSPLNIGFNITNINKDTLENIKIEVDRMMIDYKYITNANYFIGTKSSNVSFIAKLLRKNCNTILLD